MFSLTKVSWFTFVTLMFIACHKEESSAPDINPVTAAPLQEESEPIIDPKVWKSFTITNPDLGITIPARWVQTETGSAQVEILEYPKEVRSKFSLVGNNLFPPPKESQTAAWDPTGPGDCAKYKQYQRGLKNASFRRPALAFLLEELVVTYPVLNLGSADAENDPYLMAALKEQGFEGSLAKIVNPLEFSRVTFEMVAPESSSASDPEVAQYVLMALQRMMPPLPARLARSTVPMRGLSCDLKAEKWSVTMTYQGTLQGKGIRIPVHVTGLNSPQDN